MRWKLINTVFIMSALSLALVPMAAALGDDGKTQLSELKPGELTAPLDAYRDMLSGRMWLITSGLDPSLGIGLGGVKEAPPGSAGGSPAQQAGGGGSALVPYRDPSARFSRNILIPSDFSQSTFQTEPSIAIDPKDPDHILVGMIDYNFPNMVSYSSIDGGATWGGPDAAKYPRQDLGAAGDPIVAFDRNGTAYYAFISLDIEEYTVGPLLGSAIVSAISVSRSADGGLTWADPVHSSRSSLETTTLPSGQDGRPRGEIESDFLDKPWMAIGRHPDEPEKDVIYVAYTRFISTATIFWIDELPFLGNSELQTVIEFVKSEDGGLTWSDPLEVSPRARYTILFNPITQEEVTQATNVRQVVQGPDVAVAPDGTVYVAWLDTTGDDSFEGVAEIYVRRSDDAGDSFETRRRASGFQEPGFRARNAVFRSWASAFPKLGVGANGEVYVLWVAIPTDDPEDDGDVFAVTSTDRGRTWDRRVIVNDDETSTFQFFPEVSVSPNGTLHAMWGDFRDDPIRVSYHIYYASSEDGGKTWTRNSRVTDFPSNPNKAFPGGRFIGDYFAIEATDDEVYMVWADARLGEFGPVNQKIAFARKRLMPSPAVFLSPPSGPAGKDIVVQGFNFQPDRNVFLEVAGVIVSTARTQDDGRFSAQIFVPISGQGAHSVRAIEESGNVATSSFFMDFGFDSLQDATDKLDEIADSLDDLEQRLSGLPSNGSSGSEPIAGPTSDATADPSPESGESGGLSCSPSPTGGSNLFKNGDMLLLVGMMGGIFVFRRSRLRR